MVFKTSDDHSVALYHYIPLFGLHVWCQRCWYDIHLYEDMNPVLSNAFLCRRCFFYVASCLCVSTVDGGGPCWRLCFCLCLCCFCLSLLSLFVFVFVFVFVFLSYSCVFHCGWWVGPGWWWCSIVFLLAITKD